jgi:hypothetical protein
MPVRVPGPTVSVSPVQVSDFEMALESRENFHQRSGFLGLGVGEGVGVGVGVGTTVGDNVGLGRGVGVAVGVGTGVGVGVGVGTGSTHTTSFDARLSPSELYALTTK